MIRITSPSRLHLGLIDLNAEFGRVDGGAGITLDYPCIRIVAEKSDTLEVHDGSHLKNKMKQAADSVLKGRGGICIHVEEDVLSHVGLGSGTQAALCAAMAACRLYGLEYTVRELAEMAGRGGTSGIGVAGFEHGGFIVDAGHRFSRKKSFSPSAASREPPAPVIFRHDFPDWDIILAIPRIKGAHDKEEMNIFSRECPIPLAEVQAVSHTILMQMIPAIMEKDIEAFGRAVNHLQTTGFKKREIAIQSPVVSELMETMIEHGAEGAGMSSFGPAVYAISDRRTNSERIAKKAGQVLNEGIGGDVMITRGNNSGAVIEEI
ncbi:beta-ribofuranosylaminobenzene 5'-phosphate synthase family [Methanosalsum zhilinae DSM 4017]|uniref:Beta-ribofuranosylaminobenzene 5'-phosphate synthase n=1 Tax=Methanosalsum zhilinae (strain DSM 4017 / NBRC 107636 / OCM 62 / WeN5) TaxID=679901 RepID=F7XKT9_METZD|nr:beta-ribofuranosylaminobenzene 5'-phosphate synthase [Methanosalsum zhilinae]AEH61803.1 beta-ribofuranosylaminobenzene 5'-phosphate synthase family [Methanosalsum zhilinae DSM 4017]